MLRPNIVSPLLLAFLACAAGLSLLAGDAPISALDIGYWAGGHGRGHARYDFG